VTRAVAPGSVLLRQPADGPLASPRVWPRVRVVGNPRSPAGSSTLARLARRRGAWRLFYRIMEPCAMSSAERATHATALLRSADTPTLGWRA